MSAGDSQTCRARRVFGVSGVLIGILGALCGIGGGLFATPLQHYGFKIPLPRAVSTSLVLVFCTALSATIAESLAPASALDWSLALAAVPGALLGTQVGMGISKAIPTRQLKAAFAVTFVVFGLRMFFFPEALSTELAGEPSPMAHWSMLVLGLGAGLIVPVLGIGGGLILVPGCLALVPEVGFEGARALSLAIASFTSLRALWLHHREGRVDFSRGIPLGLGALLGAMVGVQLAHLSGAGAVGQALLGLILLLSAVRFGGDALRPSPP